MNMSWAAHNAINPELTETHWLASTPLCIPKMSQSPSPPIARLQAPTIRMSNAKLSLRSDTYAQPIAIEMRNSAFVLCLPSLVLSSSMASTTFMSARTLRSR